MIDRDVGRALLEVVDGIPPVAHHLMHEAVGPADGVVRAVDEAGLDAVPLGRVVVARVAVERPDVERRPALLAAGELLFGVAATAGVGHDVLVLRAEAFLQVLAPAPAGDAVGDRGQQDDGGDDDDDDCNGHVTLSLSRDHLGYPGGASQNPRHADGRAQFRLAAWSTEPEKLPANHELRIEATLTRSPGFGAWMSLPPPM